MLKDSLVLWLLLGLAALLESGGDAGVRMGLAGKRWGFLLGPLALVAYGFVVNMSKLDFSRLMGIYIAVFFLVSQGLAVVLLRERVQLPTLVGGALIVAGGLVLTLWRLPAR